MKLGLIALHLRASNTSFGNYVGGAAELAVALDGTLAREMAFIIPLAETCAPNTYDNGINQRIDETFGVVIALKNDTDQKDKYGITAYDRLHDIRAEILGSLLNWQMDDVESVIDYRGGRLLDLNPAWLWFQFEFGSTIRITDEDGYDNQADALDYLNSIYAQFVLTPNEQLPISGDLPTELLTPDLIAFIQISGGFSNGFGTGFNTAEAWAERNYEI